MLKIVAVEVQAVGSSGTQLHFCQTTWHKMVIFMFITVPTSDLTSLKLSISPFTKGVPSRTNCF